jgi:hypothetical protein
VSSFDGDSGMMGRCDTFRMDSEYRLRLAGNAADKAMADRIANEVIGLYSTGPAGGGGVRRTRHEARADAICISCSRSR